MKLKRYTGNSKGEKDGVVVDKRTEIKKLGRPTPFDTTSFLRASSSIGIQTQRAMSIAESLYMQGYITYPRTDNTVYPRMDINGMLKKFLSSEFSDLAAMLMEERIYPSKGSKESKDHPPIHPTALIPKEGKMKEQEKKIYGLIVKRFFATYAPYAEIEDWKMKMKIKDEVFKCDGRTVLKKGWTKYYPSRIVEVEKPEFGVGDKIPVELRLVELETKPPKRISQGELVEAMEKDNLGTKSTRAEIIGKLYSRDYIRDNPPKVTPKGIGLISALELSGVPLTSPELTQNMEMEMDGIEKNRIEMGECIEKSRTILEGVMDEMLSKKDAINLKLREALSEQRYMGSCKVCGSRMELRRSKKGNLFVGCTNYPKCNNAYPFPSWVRNFDLLGNCELCGAPKIAYRYKGKKIEICLNMNCPANPFSRSSKEKEKFNKD